MRKVSICVRMLLCIWPSDVTKHVSSMEKGKKQHKQQQQLKIDDNSTRRNGHMMRCCQNGVHHSNWIWRTISINFSLSLSLSLGWQLYRKCKHLWLYYRLVLATAWSGDFDWVRGVFNWNGKHKQYQLMAIEMASVSFFRFYSFFQCESVSESVFRWTIECYGFFVLCWW